MTARVREGDPLESVEVCDTYLAAWLVLNGCTIARCTRRPEAGPLGGLVVFRGPRVHELVQEYFNHGARVEIWEFRAATNQITRCLHEAGEQQRQTLGAERGEGGVS